MVQTICAAIESGEPHNLRALLAADPEGVERDTSGGDGSGNRFPPLHLVCDAVFRGCIADERAVELADVLLEAGVDLGRVFPKTGDTYLISAASLGAEAVGVRLVERGIDVHARGLFGASALHWALFMGAPRLAAVLADAGCALEERDTQYECTPLEWGLHAWLEGTNGRREGIPPAVGALVERGARVPPRAREALVGDAHAELRRALG